MDRVLEALRLSSRAKLLKGRYAALSSALQRTSFALENVVSLLRRTVDRMGQAELRQYHDDLARRKDPLEKP
jgi:hypothetical protein